MCNHPNGDTGGIIVMVEEEEAAEEIRRICTVLVRRCLSNHKIQAELTHFLASLQAQAENY